ncbi:MAG: nucleoside triphosphate pyrophosphohydrolase [Eggerthellaceae bacterium]|nr:nucleoside triphosphate pyrophosphohydrolase [Eggerthellaceae bacterium]
MAQKNVADVCAQEHPDFDAFVATIEALRAPDGCPWDREQTHQSIAHNMIEEAYEAVDAIERGSVAHLREELGDVLLQVVLQSQIAADAGEFTIEDVCRDVNEKMIRRHPHVFGDAAAADSGEVLGLWDQVKLAEKEAADKAAAQGAGQAAEGAAAEGSDDAVTTAAAGAIRPEGLLDGVPTSFPALMQAQKISRKAAAAGFEWDTIDDIWSKVAEEFDELKDAYEVAPKSTNGKIVKTGDDGASFEAAQAAAAVELEFGDALFSLVNVGRRMGVDAESALRATCAKFRQRWAFMEGAALARESRVEDLTSEELEELWMLAKLLLDGMGAYLFAEEAAGVAEDVDADAADVADADAANAGATTVADAGVDAPGVAPKDGAHE